MKRLITPVFLLLFLQFPGSNRSQRVSHVSLPVSRNLIIVTIDGFRWQELFTGADSTLINNTRYTLDTSITKRMYWDDDPLVRRKMLLPFFWNVLAGKGQVFGNRNSGNRVEVANPYAKSYPGYNEILTGVADPAIASNRRIPNPNINVLEYMNDKPDFHGQVAVFSSWDVFPYIINSSRNDVFVNSGYENVGGQHLSVTESLINRLQQSELFEKGSTRFDQLTFLAAKEYLLNHRPRLLFLALGETDEFAHEGRYDLYLNHVSQVDRMIGELWHWVQTTPGYKDETTLIITTDHGRGSRDRNWAAHGRFIRGSEEAWIAVIGANIRPLGELQGEGQLYQQQLAPTIAGILGEEFAPPGNSIRPISLR